MKTFLDLLNTASNQTIEINIDLRPIVDNGVPWATVIVNDICLLDQHCSDFTNVTCQVPLMASFKIVVEMHNKIYDEHRESALVIERLEIDDHLILPKFNHLTQYTNDHDKVVYSNYLGYNGTWVLHIDKPFYQWFHHANNRGWLLHPSNKF